MALKFIFGFLLFTSAFAAQNDSVKAYIGRLHNDQFDPEGSYIGWRIKSHSLPRQALEGVGYPAAEALITALGDSTKFIMAHLTLADIYQERTEHMSVVWDSITRRVTVRIHLSDTLQLFAHERYHGLSKQPTYYQDEENIKKIIAFWRRRQNSQGKNGR